jgi:anaerobic selenocysteine-containing dehydrogenase
MSSLAQLLYDANGPLTRELLLTPGGFGLGQIPDRRTPDSTTLSVCGFCSTGCGLNIHLRDGAAIGLTPMTDYPVNLGMACPKGWEALKVLDSKDRATQPLLRDARGKLQPVDWPTAMKEFAARFKAIQAQHGPESVAFLGTGQMVTEELAFLGALAKFGMGMRHGDGNTRQCMATSVVAYKESFGFDAPPYTYADLEESDTLVFIGANPCIAHPILWERVMRNRQNPQIVVIDPRRTETAMQATLHLPAYPKSDLVLLYCVARELVERGWIDQDYISNHTNGFAEFAAFVEPFTIDVASRETRLSAGLIEHFIELIHSGKRVSFWWTMGVNQSHQGVRTAQAIINLALMTGSMGRPGTGANSITGQCNAMGSRLFSNTTNLLGGRDFTKPEHRRHVAKLLELPEDRITTQPSWSYDQIMEGVIKGSIRGLWIVCTNTAHSWINQDYARDVLSRLDFLVVQDIYNNTDTTDFAHLVLPAAGWGEKDGTFINSERRLGVVRKVSHAPGQALADFSIFRLVAEAWGCESLFKKWKTPEAVFQMLKALSVGQPCDFSGIRDYAHLEEARGIQWPHPAGDPEPAPERRLFTNGQYYHADGRARFIADSPREFPEKLSDQYPLILNTGRGTASQWHTQTRTAKSDVLRKLYPENVYVEINSEDARKLKIGPNSEVRITSRRGSITAMAMLTAAVQPGQIFLPMHYVETNRLTDAVFDPHSRQPSYKTCAVRIEPAA